MMKVFLRFGFAAALSFAAMGPSLAQGIEIGPDGLQIVPEGRRGGYDDRRDDRYDSRRRDRGGISEREAVRIARGEGLREVDGVSRQRRTIRVDGGDRRGRDITVIIDSRTGDVVDVR